ncbi:hypothetical protein BD309DRAFT_773987 [Dichomitus squalens]|nr:hypothetical protein BD309DRAFT_773987 [Dichomitus squalens]
MYAWYRLATVCYAFLPDVDGVDPLGSVFSLSEQLKMIVQSRWFARGWTLQELIAPANVVFLSRNWHFLGTNALLADAIEKATGIVRGILLHQVALDQVGVATHMSWAARRRTTRIEDEAYSLLGIFGINMPTLYGECRHAFVRLQEEILERIYQTRCSSRGVGATLRICRPHLLPPTLLWLPPYNTERTHPSSHSPLPHLRIQQASVLSIIQPLLDGLVSRTSTLLLTRLLRLACTPAFLSYQPHTSFHNTFSRRACDLVSTTTPLSSSLSLHVNLLIWKEASYPFFVSSMTSIRTSRMRKGSRSPFAPYAMTLSILTSLSPYLPPSSNPALCL